MCITVYVHLLLVVVCVKLVSLTGNYMYLLHVVINHCIAKKKKTFARHKFYRTQLPLCCGLVVSKGCHCQ